MVKKVKARKRRSSSARKDQDPVLAGLLVGKYHKARELNVILELNPDSLLGSITRKDMLERVVSILGNLIDNAIEAAIRLVIHVP